jgi:hypothetical protein
LPVQLGAQVPQTVLAGGKQLVPLAQVSAQVPPQLSGPPHLPAQLGAQGPPSLSPEGLPGAWTAGPDSVDEEHADNKTAADKTGPNVGFLIDRRLPRRSVRLRRP